MTSLHRRTVTTSSHTTTSAARDYLQQDAELASQTYTYNTVVDWLRSRFDLIPLLRKDVKAARQDRQSGDLLELTQTKGKLSVRQLLAELAEDRGMSWADIARLSGVSVSAVRKWRNGGEASGESRMTLAKLAAFLDLLEKMGVEDPAQWLEMPLALPEGYRLRAMDLYAKGHVHALLEIADHHDAAEVLDELDDHWRERRSDYEVIDGPDGGKAIKIRPR